MTTNVVKTKIQERMIGMTSILEQKMDEYVKTAHNRLIENNKVEKKYE